jgi:hypothetical protein
VRNTGPSNIFWSGRFGTCGRFAVTRREFEASVAASGHDTEGVEASAAQKRRDQSAPSAMQWHFRLLQGCDLDKRANARHD